MIIYSEPFDKNILLEMQEHYFGDMVKGVVDSLINIRPNQGNRSRSIDDPVVRDCVKEIINSLCK